MRSIIKLTLVFCQFLSTHFCIETKQFSRIGRSKTWKDCLFSFKICT